MRSLVQIQSSRPKNDMIQRVSVRICIVSDGRTLLVRRAQGRSSILGKYELPGGRVNEGEQPENAARRYASDSLGMSKSLHLQLSDAMTYVDSDDRTIQYAVIVYRASVGKTKRAVSLGSYYDKYLWYTAGKLDNSAITDVSQIILGTPPTLVASGTKSPSDQRSDEGVVVYTDGGSRGNPGPSAGGYVVIEGGEIIDQGGEYLGITTNNQAEYHGARLGLEAAARLGVQSLEVRVDSMLVANQLNGIYKIKNRDLWPVNERVRELIGQFKRVKFVHIPRELNQLADGMVNRTLDQQKNKNML